MFRWLKQNDIQSVEIPDGTMQWNTLATNPVLRDVLQQPHWEKAGPWCKTSGWLFGWCTPTCALSPPTPQLQQAPPTGSTRFMFEQLFYFRQQYADSTYIKGTTKVYVWT